MTAKRFVKSNNRIPPPQPMKSTTEKPEQKRLYQVRAVSKDEAVVSPTLKTDAVTKIQSLIESVEGSESTITYDKHSGMPHMIQALIPSQNVTLLLENITRIGTIKKTLPSVPIQGNSSLPN